MNGFYMVFRVFVAGAEDSVTDLYVFMASFREQSEAIAYTTNANDNLTGEDAPRFILAQNL